MAFLRYDQQQIENGLLLVVLNFSAQIQKVKLEHEHLVGNFTNIFSGLSFPFNKELSIELLPGDYFVYVKGKG
jgi:hypothetical protein